MSLSGGGGQGVIKGRGRPNSSLRKRKDFLWPRAKDIYSIWR